MESLGVNKPGIGDYHKMGSGLRDSVTIAEQCGCGKVYVTIIEEDGEISRVHATAGKWGTCLMLMLTTASTMFNELLERGMPIREALLYINNKHCHRGRPYDSGWTYSCLDAISKAVRKRLAELANNKRIHHETEIE